MIERFAYARAGIIGNPSDGYNGKCIAFTFEDFRARAVLEESDRLQIEPCEQDRGEWDSLNALVSSVREKGYYGGVRLVKAAIMQFYGYCEEHGIALHDRNFRIAYDSNIPRQVGLAGSSALVVATLRCVMDFYDVTIPREVQPNLVLSAEMKELGISAGLMDRVIQVYEGCVYMDLNKPHIEEHGHGIYEPLDPAQLPPLFIAYRTSLSEGSDVFHNNVRERFLQGDPDVVQAMKDFPAYAEEVRALLLAGRGAEIGPIMDRNFDRRASIYNVGESNLDMVGRARAAGGHAKFTGSGGAIVGTYPDEATYQKIVEAYEGTHTAVLKPRLVGANVSQAG